MNPIHVLIVDFLCGCLGALIASIDMHFIVRRIERDIAGKARVP